MPVRIYALAKELNVDSKDLVDIVKKTGITGKGSALASLADDEAQRVRDYLSGGEPASTPKTAKKAAAEPAATPMAAVRDSVAPAGRRPAAIDLGRTAPKEADKKPRDREPTAAPTPKLAPAPSAPETPAPAPVATGPKPEVKLDKKSIGRRGPLGGKADTGKPSTTKPQTSKVQPSAPAEPAAPVPAPAAPPAQPPAKKGIGGMASRIAGRMGGGPHGKVVPNTPGQPVASVRSEGALSGKMRSLDRSAAAPVKKDEDASKPKRRGPQIKINLAQLPDAPAPGPVATKPGEPAAQKPDIKLSKDIIAGHKQGMKAPLERLAKEDADKDKEKSKTKRTPAGLTGFTDKKRIEEEEKPRKKGLAGMASARADRSRGGRSRMRNDDRGGRSYQRRTFRRKGASANTAAPRNEKVTIEMPCTIRSFCESAGIGVSQVLRVLMGMQMMVNINSEIDFELATALATELELDIELTDHETLEDELITTLEEQEDDEDSLISRAPIVTFLGHVDHGKTSLLDYLIGINVVSGEAGGITQHIRAYEVDKDGRSVTFVDTPGHEAFTEMRARGANVTDIAVLVIAADDGIMPQTEEAISHAKAAGVPIVVALNKCDLEGVDTNRVMTQLTEHQLTPSEWGGEVEVVRTSAITGEGMDELLETLLTVAELNEYRANPERAALGVCLESQQQGDRGVVAKMVVQNGTMRIGDVIVCGPSHGRVRAMSDPLTGVAITEAGPSTPVSVMGLDQPPGAGDRFHVLDDIVQAREIASTRSHESSRENLSGVTTKVSFENFQEMLLDGRLGETVDKVKLNLIIRADAKGSLEAIDKELSKFDHPEVELRILQRSVGGVTLADATLASASEAVVLAFNVIPDEKARALADERNVQIRRYDVIYKLTDDIKAMIEGRLKPEERVVELGRALVKMVFSISRVGTIAGCYVLQGSIQRGCRIRVNRDQKTIGDYPLDTLRRIKEDVKEVPRGMECGIRLSGFNDIKQDDVLEAYKIEEFARTLD